MPTRLLIGGTGALVGGSFGILAMKLTHRVHSFWPWVVAFVGIASVVVLQRLLRRQVMVNFAMQKDEQAAEQIQTRLRPELLPQPAGYELAGFYFSRRDVGGDYYETMLLDDRRLLITIADVSGKGAGAALLTANLQAILKFVDLDERPLGPDRGRHQHASLPAHRAQSFHHHDDGRAGSGIATPHLRQCGHNPAMLRRGGGVSGSGRRRHSARSRGWSSLPPRR